MAGQVTSPLVHLFGPAGCGKSTFAKQLADLVGCTLHTINVSRISPLELEGVQMPTQGKLELLLSTYWSNLQDGDIVLLDEFLRGFPEVYNGLLDILTSREVAGYRLPNVMFIAASNSTTTYDAALADRLLNMPVPDPRSSKSEYKRITEMIVTAAGLLPQVAHSFEMERLMDSAVLPMYTVMDPFSTKVSSSSAASSEVQASPRNLIGQIKLRMVMNNHLHGLLEMNNQAAMSEGKPQYVVVYSYRGATPIIPTGYAGRIAPVFGKLSPEQQKQAGLNLQFIKAQETTKGV